MDLTDEQVAAANQALQAYYHEGQKLGFTDREVRLILFAVTHSMVESGVDEDTKPSEAFHAAMHILRTAHEQGFNQGGS